LPVPAESTHVVHDLSTGLNGRARHIRFVRVNRDYRIRTLLFQRPDHRQNPLQLFLFIDWLFRRLIASGSRTFRCSVLAGHYVRARAGGFAPDVNDVGAVIQQL
jgi:hypothetical protein